MYMYEMHWRAPLERAPQPGTLHHMRMHVHIYMHINMFRCCMYAVYAPCASPVLVLAPQLPAEQSACGCQCTDAQGSCARSLVHQELILSSDRQPR